MTNLYYKLITQILPGYSEKIRYSRKINTLYFVKRYRSKVVTHEDLNLIRYYYLDHMCIWEIMRCMILLGLTRLIKENYADICYHEREREREREREQQKHAGHCRIVFINV